MKVVANTLIQWMSGSVLGKQNKTHIRHIKETGMMVLAHSGNPNGRGDMTKRLAWREKLGNATRAYWQIMKDDKRFTAYRLAYLALPAGERKKMSLRQFIYRDLLGGGTGVSGKYL